MGKLSSAAAGHSRIKPPGSAPRKVCVALSGSPKNTSWAPAPPRACRSRMPAGVNSCASSTTTSRQGYHAWASSAGSSRTSAAAPRIQAGSKDPGDRIAVTSSYSASTAAAATHSGCPCCAPRSARRCADRPSSTARISRSRNSDRKPFVGNASSRCAGQAGANPGSAACPARSSARMTSCSGPVMSRGAGSPRSAADRRISPKASDCIDRAKGPLVVPPTAAVTSSRNLTADSRLGARIRQASAANSPPATRSATIRVANHDLPEPGAPRMRSTAPRCSIAACCTSSGRALGAGERAGCRRVGTCPISSRTTDSTGPSRWAASGRSPGSRRVRLR